MPAPERKIVQSRLLPHEISRFKEVCAHESMRLKRPVGQSEMIAILIAREYGRVSRKGKRNGARR